METKWFPELGRSARIGVMSVNPDASSVAELEDASGVVPAGMHWSLGSFLLNILFFCIFVTLVAVVMGLALGIQWFED